MYYLWWSSVFLGSEFVCAEKGSAEIITPII